ncbi:hypothetical protein JFT44_11400 [Pseudomonas sp. MF5691]|uniref:hypothetical protein n=1 Tax=unclassified Pseudomonas TaxID=196821 RepID=UPI0018E81051|nr:MULTISPECIES: hypothetical protein [unclassified Pseudomonas]MBJ2290539.1 hypothetical protein [Pseudomonas sp. MF5691]MDD2031628.1 TniQ family protein [Pseudomonas sp. 39167]
MWLTSAPAADFDPDFSLNSSFANAACEAVGMSRELRATLIQPPSSWLIPRFYRRTFCYQCLAEQFRVYELPTSLKHWCAVSTVICVHHSLPLIDAAEVFGPKLNMAMKFFQMQVLYKERYLSASRFQDGMRSIKSLQLVQDMLNNFEMETIQGGLSRDTHQVSEWEFSKFLICLMLYPRFGLINRYMRNDAVYLQLPVFQQTFTLGPLIASIAHRRVALLILGWLYEVLPADDSSVIEALLDAIGSAIGFSDAYGLGSSCNGFSPDHSAVIARRLVQWHPLIASSRAQQFVEGFTASIGK